MVLLPLTFRAQSKLRFFELVFAAWILCIAHGQDLAVSDTSRDTVERVKDPGWWPTKGMAARSEYAGSEACSECHGRIAAMQKQTPMFMTASRPDQSAILNQHGDLRFWDGNLNYAIARQGHQFIFTVVDQSGSLSAPVKWAIGTGEIGQTYVLKAGSTYLESRLSYFSSLQRLDITPGHSNDVSGEFVLGMPLDQSTVMRCLGCHTTGSTVSGNFDPENAVPGVRCEACHGPGTEHINAERQGNDKADWPLNPEYLSPVDSVDFCGACHRTSADVTLHMQKHLGLIGVRFQPYRLERSLCWGASGDARITCIACHDPHRPLVRDIGSYDVKCLQCHAESNRLSTTKKAHACSVANRNCASCHMPRYEVKPAHATFTDHFIRIVRPGSKFRE